jgi:hypothetical protein
MGLAEGFNQEAKLLLSLSKQATSLLVLTHLKFSSKTAQCLIIPVAILFWFS